jgi:hypothetical protein
MRRWLMFIFIAVSCCAAYADNPLQKTYDAAISDEVRRNIREYTGKQADCKECVRLLDTELVGEVVKHEFVVFAVEPSNFGGKQVYIAIDTMPRRYFKLWMYDLDSTVYQLRDIREILMEDTADNFGVDLNSLFTLYARGF